MPWLSYWMEINTRIEGAIKTNFKWVTSVEGRQRFAWAEFFGAQEWKFSLEYDSLAEHFCFYGFFTVLLAS